MPLSEAQAIAEAKRLYDRLTVERRKLDPVRRYWTGRQGLPLILAKDVPAEVREMARVASGINVIGIVVEALQQSLFVDGFRGRQQSDNADVWSIWQANSLDARQGGIHRPALAYGVGYATVWPAAMLPDELRIWGNQEMPVIRGTSPRLLTAEYDRRRPSWPTIALENVGGGEYWLYDDEAIYTFGREKEQWTLTDTKPHELGRTPVVRYLEVEDPDAEDEAREERVWTRHMPEERLVSGQVAPLMALQDQISLTTFALLVAQQYGAFRQRYIIGWTGATEEKAIKMAASRLQIFKDPPDQVQAGEWSQTELGGYIESREAALKYAATLSQTPVHELVGELVNLSAEALAAAEAGRDRRVDERKTMFGESHEQTLRLAGQAIGVDVPDTAQAVWRDTSARAFAAVVDALGKLVTMLGIPAEELWERVPGATQEDVARWKTRSAEGDAMGNLTSLLERQTQSPAQVEAADLKAKSDAMGALIRAGATPESAAAQVGLEGLVFTGGVPVTLRFPQREAAGLEETPGSAG